MHTFLNKWVSATVPLVLFFLLFGYFNPHDVLVLLVWAAPITYIYGIGMSYLMDWIVRKWEVRNKISIGLLYMVAGALFFIPFSFVFSSFAEWGAFLGFAAIGAGISLTFYVCSLLFRNRKVNWVIAVGGPIFLLVMMQLIVFQWETPKKEGWAEQRTDSAYEASFRYFHGEQPVTIQAKKGQRIIFEITWTELKGSSIGHYTLGPDGEHAAMEERGVGRYAILADETGPYQVVVTGRKLEDGSFKVDWVVEGG